MRKKFFEVFKKNEDGSLTPNETIKIGSVMLGAGSVKFSKGISFAGVNIFEYYGKDMEVEYKNDILVIKGFYEEDE